MSRTRNSRGALQQVCAPALRRTKLSDVFERDPFKIHSYNFHYAERPAYPVQSFRRPETSKETPDKEFATYYYNPNFKTRQDGHNKENVNISGTTNQRAPKFDEFRRRKFLYESLDTKKLPVPKNTGISEWFKQLPSATVTPQQRQKNNNKSMFCRFPGGVDVTAGAAATTTNPPLLRTCCNRDYLQRRGSSTCNLPHQTSSTNVLSRRDSTMQQQPQKRRSNSQIRMNAAIAAHVSRLAQASNSRASLATVSVTQTHAAGRDGKCTPSTLALNRHKLAKETSGSAARSSMPASSTTTRRDISQKRSTCSGCEININISAMDDNDPSENVRIKIATDGCLRTKNSATRVTRPASAREHARSRSMADYSRSVNSIVRIDKHLSKYSLNGLNQNVATLKAPMRRCELNAQERYEEHQAERARARERERERMRLRELDRARDEMHLAQLEREREHERQMQIENDKLAEMAERLRILNELKRQCEMERSAQSMRRAALVQVVPMTSHLYRQASTERIPSIVPIYDSAKRNFAAPPKQNSRHDVRAQRTQNACNVLGSLRGLKPSPCSMEQGLARSSNSALLSHQNNSTTKPMLNQSRTSLHTLNSFDESKLINTNNQFRTTLNNVPVRIATSTSRNQLPDVAFRAVRVRDDSPSRPLTQNAPPYNVNINVYTDKMRMMRF